MADIQKSWDSLFVEAGEAAAESGGSTRKSVPASGGGAQPAAGVTNLYDSMVQATQSAQSAKAGAARKNAAAQVAGDFVEAGTDAANRLKSVLQAVGAQAASVQEAPLVRGQAVDTADATTFVYVHGGEGVTERKFEIRISSDELQSGISVQDCRSFCDADNALINASRAVRQQKLFATWEREGALRELASGYPFVPFDYQFRNVRIMLNRFEGRGVFGDQVGLGKTVEALMTAHAMFASGAIRNALIVVPSNTRRGWISEIKNKFPVLSLRNLEECESPHMTYSGVVNKIKTDNASNVKGNRVYIMTEGMLRNNIQSVRDEIALHKRAALIMEEPDERTLSCLAGIENKIKGTFGDRKFDPFVILAEHGFSCPGDCSRCFHCGDDGECQNPGRTAFSSRCLADPSVPVCERLCGIMEEAMRYYGTYTGRIERGVVESKKWQAEQILEHLRERIGAESEAYREVMAEDTTDVFSSGDIDLLIVDEVHSFYSKQNDDVAETMIEFLGEIVNKKYCILMSATPVRESLDNIFDLLYMLGAVAGNEGYSEKKKKFYSSFCRFEEEAANGTPPFALARMVMDDEKSRSFFGMINNFFTRQRIGGVEMDMKGDLVDDNGVYIPFNNLPEACRDKLTNCRSSILNARKLMYMQRDAVEQSDVWAEYAYRLWRGEKPTVGDAEYARWMALNSNAKDTQRHTRAAVDAVLIDIANDRSQPLESRRSAHALADWRRRSKKGLAVAIDVGCVCNADRLVLVLQEVDMALRMGDKRLLGCVEDRENFRARLWSDAVVAYVSRKSDNEHEPIRKRFADKLSRLRHDTDRRFELDFEGRNVNCLMLSPGSLQTGELTEGDSKQLNITVDNYHQFMILDQGMQAGINLQQFHTLIFMQMDWQGQRLLEPVDIEQWIGRIHRTGQVKTARIITVLTTFMQEARKNPEQEFLRWYYEILDDAKGLDLYGDTTPDIAFLQPVIVDALRAVINMGGDYPQRLLEVMTACGVEKGPVPTVVRAAKDKMKLTKESNTRRYSFSELLELFYYMGDNWKKLVRELVRTLCTDHRFGKPGTQDGEEV